MAGYSTLYTHRLQSWGSTTRYNPPATQKATKDYVVTNSVSHSGALKGYKSIIARHGNATTDLTGSSMKVEYQQGFIVTGIKSPYTFPFRWVAKTEGCFLGSGVSFPSASAVSLTSADSSAYMAALKKIRRASTDFQSLTFLGELRESLHMIRNPAETLVKGLHQYLGTIKDRVVDRGRRLTMKKTNRIIADSWLEYSFGWAPLVNDIQDAVKAYEKLGNAEHYRKFSEFSNQQWEDAVTVDRTYSFYPENAVLRTIKTMFEAEVKYYGEIKVAVVNPDVSGFLSRGGFNFREVLPTAWELVPWSFAVDYFTNVGDIIEASSMSFANLAWIAKGTKQKATRFVTARPDVAYIKSILKDSYDGVTGYGGSLTLTSERKTRTVPPLEVPTLSFEIPGLKSNKVKNLAALAVARSKTLSQQIVSRF